jgi:hypothetical protein
MHRCGWLLWLCVGMAAAQAQKVEPLIDAARANAPAVATPPVAADAIVRAFVGGCVAHEGDPTRTVDWAIEQGFEPADAQAGAGAALLSGQPGTLLSMPGSAGQVVLAIDQAQRCTVWAERGDGPAVRAEFVKAMNALAAKGARVRPMPERTIERGGAWRLQVQMRYRRAGGSQDFGVGAVTTFTPQPTAQVLSAAPIP